MILGDDSTEITATLKYNHNKNTVTTDVVIPDYDLEAGIKLALTDTEAKGKKMRGITIDVTNKNIPQLTLIGRTRYKLCIQWFMLHGIFGLVVSYMAL